MSVRLEEGILLFVQPAGILSAAKNDMVKA